MFENDDFSSDSESAYSSESERPDAPADGTNFYCGDDENSDEDDLCPDCHHRKTTAQEDTLPTGVTTGDNAVICLDIYSG